MASLPKTNGKEEPLNDSWVELHFQSQLSRQGSKGSSPTPAMSKPVSYGHIEKALLEAQKDWSKPSSTMGSNASSRGSPKSPHSPNSELTSNILAADIGPIRESQMEGPIESQMESQMEGSDWIWDWSSRPEAVQPSDGNGARFKHPRKLHKYSVRNTPVMRGGSIYSLENLPVLLLSHACTFFLGAAAMFIFLKKYCNWSVSTTPAINY